jgi:hypothetical protein
MPFTAIYGLPGRGKSLLMLQRALLLAEKYNLRIVSNFQLDPIQLAYYCKINNYQWLMSNIPNGIIYYVSANRNFAQFLQIKNAVIILDEMGLYAPSAQSWTLPSEALNAIANNRKNLQHIIYAAQYPSQVNSSIHEVCSEILYAEGLAVWCNKLRNDKLVFKDVHQFKPAEFQVWFRDPKVRKNPIKSVVLAEKHWKGVISCNDAQTFRVYNSFQLLEKQDDEIISDDSIYRYKPFIVDPKFNTETSMEEVAESGHSFKLLEEKLDEFYKSASNSKKKKKIYEATGDDPFIAWKLVGNIPICGIHPLQKHLTKFWYFFPAASYPGLVKIDMAVTREFKIWNRLDDETKKSYKLTFKVSLGALLFVFSLIVSAIFSIKHPLVLSALYFGCCVYLPNKLIK